LSVYDSASGNGLIAGPMTNSAVPVTNGIFSVTPDFGPGVFTGPARWVEIAARPNGNSAFTLLGQRQLVTATPYATFAGGVNAAGISGSISAANIANATITGPMLAAGAAAANLNSSGQSLVPSGGMILSANASDPNLLNAGYAKLGKAELGDV